MIALILAGATETAKGQPGEDGSHTILLSVGAEHHRFVDEAFTSSRMVFAGTSVGGALSYRRAGGPSFLQLRVQGSAGEVATSGARLASSLVQFGLDASFGKRVARYTVMGARSAGYVAAQLSSANSVVLNEVVLENASVTFLHTAGLSLHQTTRFGGKGELQLDLALPLAGWIKRATYDGGANQQLERDRHHAGRLLFGDGKPSLVNPFAALRFGVAYTRRLARKTDLAIRYQTGYLRLGRDAPIRAYHNGLQVGLSYNL